MLEKICKEIEQNDNFAIIPHVNPDGDAIGSCMALCSAIRSMGKSAYILLDRDVPRNIKFMWDDAFLGSPDDSYDVCILLDHSDVFRMCCGKEEVYEKAKLVLCIDHHITAGDIGDVCYVDPSAAATGEIIYTLITQFMNIPLTKDMATYLYASIASDTGNFKFSNTLPYTHRIAANLMETGINIAHICENLFDKKTLSQLLAEKEAIENLVLECGGRVATTYIDYKYIEDNFLTFDDTDFLVNLPRNIDGVEVGVFFKVRSDDEIKVSFRSGESVDVASLASKFGGGGHIRAAGCTYKGTLSDARRDIIKEISIVLGD